MRVLDLGPAVGRAIRDHGSHLTLTPLMRPDDRANAVLLHFAPGDEVGAHPAGETQLLCVVAGEGWVTGGDGRRVELRAFQAACFERGEVHAAGSASGMSALVVEGDFEVAASSASRSG